MKSGQPIPLMKGDKISDDVDYRDALPVNMVVVQKPIRGAAGYLISHPGLTEFAQGLGGDRGGYWNERLNALFRVSGQNLIKVNDNGTIDDFGFIAGGQRASMTHSFNTQSIVADKRWWLYDGSNLTEQLSPNLGEPIDHTWIDGYYVFTDGEYLYHTNILDETVIDPLRFATAEYSPDPTLAVDKTSDNLVIAFNRFTTEWFQNTGGDNFAFSRISQKTVKCGIVATHCETELEGDFYVIGGGREESVSVHMIAGGDYATIASREVDIIIGSYTEDQLQTAVLETRSKNGQRYILVRLPNHTLLYDKAVSEVLGKDYAWTIVKSAVQSGGAWRGINGVYKPNVGWIYGDLSSPVIGKLDDSVATQYGDQVESIMWSPLVTIPQMSIYELELDIAPGHQINTGNVTTFISMTYDGVTWGKEASVKYGTRHEYDNQFIAYRLGYVDNFFGIKFRTVSPERVAFSRMTIQYG